MKKNTITTDEVVIRLSETFESFDATRHEGLKTSAAIQELKNETQLREKNRLVRKYGENHPKVINLEARLSYGQSAEKGLRVEIENNDVTLEPFMPDSWRVHGRVLNSELTGIANLTLSLFDDKMKWLRDLGRVCTDDNGFLSLTVTDNTGKLFEKYKGKALILTVSQDGKEVIYQDKDPLYLEVGTIEYRQIILGEEQCPPPDPDGETWTVKGVVMNKRKKPLPGLIVKILDPDNKFEKLLGQKETGQEGEFEFVYAITALKKLIKADPDLFVFVLDASGKELYKSKDPIHYKAGNVEVLEIFI